VAAAPSSSAGSISIRTLLFAPSRTIPKLVNRPAPLAWLTGTALVVIAARVALMATAVGRQAFVDQWVQRAEAFGVVVNDATFARLESLGGYAPAYGAGVGLALGVLLPLLTGAILKALGRSGTSWPVALTLAGYANLPLAVRELIALPLGYARETLASPLTLGSFFPMLDEASPAARFLWSVDVFVLWWLVLVALGAAAISGRRAMPLAATLAGAYALVGLVLAAAMFVSGGA